MDIGSWLRSLGLERYEAAFRENEIDETVLPSLTHETLKELGVTAVGHRLKLLGAIAALGSDGATKPRSADEATVPAAPSVPAEDRAERRQVTVMFSDLVGSTALSARMDPEDLREVISAYQQCVAKTVQRLGGFVAKYMGDGVLIYFGYPHAHEDDAERAVRAGLELTAAVTALKASAPLQTRVGIATGLVVVGDLIGSGEAQERGIVGETPNLAARLQGIADPNTVVIAEATRKLLGNLFELDEVGPKDLKGIAGPVRAFAALRPRSVESRFEALHASVLTALVGREEELELLLRRWARAMNGEGQVVLLSGEPGIGKSRLTAALLERLAGEPHTRLRYFCSPQATDSALFPVIGQMERAAGFACDDDAEARLDKLEALASPEDVALLAELLSLPTVRYPASTASPQRKKEQTFTALLRQLEALARSRPALMLFEDLHWIDPSSRELLDRMIERAVRLPLLLVLTFRPEFQAPWTGLSHVTSLTLSRLDPQNGAAMVSFIAGERALPEALAAKIVERADGVPLFVEELARAVIEAQGSREGVERALSATAPAAAGVPAALHASLMARLDRLGPMAREVAQIGAVIGRDFTYELLAPVAGRSEAELTNALGRLADAGLVFQRGAPPQAAYLFKHALVRDVAYASLLRRRRQELHAHIAAQLEARFPDSAEAQPELLAHHFTEAGLGEQAVAYWHRAGERAVARSANVEAAAHFGRGIDVLNTLPESAARDERELALQVARIAPLQNSQGHASSETEHAAACALAISRRVAADTHAHFWALYALTLATMVRGALRLARDLGVEALGVAMRLQDPQLVAYGHGNLGLTELWFGEYGEARTHLERALALYDPNWSHAATFRAGMHLHIYRAMLGRVLWHLGYPDRALHMVRQAIAAADESGHPFTLTDVFQWAAVLHQLRRALMTWVLCRIKRSRVRCSIKRPCCSVDLICTKRMVGRRTASQIASASAASFLLRLT
jgi:class 3 adenylate cyclase/tetratricopeptide (TPR) repeat protein